MCSVIPGLRLQHLLSRIFIGMALVATKKLTTKQKKIKKETKKKIKTPDLDKIEKFLKLSTTEKINSVLSKDSESRQV